VGNEALTRAPVQLRMGVYMRVSTANSLAVLAGHLVPAGGKDGKDGEVEPTAPRGRLAIALSGEARAGGGDKVQYEPAALRTLPRPECERCPQRKPRRRSPHPRPTSSTTF
jgi:hypothetical protein